MVKRIIPGYGEEFPRRKGLKPEIAVWVDLRGTKAIEYGSAIYKLMALRRAKGGHFGWDV